MALLAVSGEPAIKRRRVAGPENDVPRTEMYECSRYVWLKKRQEAWTEPDRKFADKRMALLYVAKMNSDSLRRFAATSGKQWSDLCSSSGAYAVSPNAPFELERFLEFSDEDLQAYAKAVGNVLNVRKAPEGAIYSFKPVSLGTVGVDELLNILSGSEEE